MEVKITYVRRHENEVCLPLKSFNNNRRNHHNHKVPQPIAANPNSGTLHTSLQRQDFRDINPRHAVDASAEDEHVCKEEGDRGRRSGHGGGSAFEAEQDGNHHHGEAKTAAAPEHCLTPAHLVQEEGEDKRAEHEHHVDAATEDLGEFGLYADVLDEDG